MSFKRGDKVHIVHGITGEEFGRDGKVYVVHGQSPRGRADHWIVPEGGDAKRDGKYWRADRMKLVPSPVQKSDLEKGTKEIAMAAAIGAASLAHSNLTASVSPQRSTHTQVQQDAKTELHPDLKHISIIESSGGKNKNHEMTNVGLNAGHTAGGSTGLMPITVQETLKKNPELGKKYAHLANASHGEITKQINAHPDMEAEIANSHWSRLNHVFGGDRMKMAYAWRNGITAAKQAKHEDITRHPYVQKFLTESAKSKMAMAKSELAKMSRPKITFPGFKKLNTRPDQEVQTVETGRQKEIYGRKVANAELSSIKPGAKFRLSGSRTAHTKETGIAAYGKKISSKFDRNTLGMEHPTPQGPKSAALVGQARSKFEAGDDDYNKKLTEHHEKKLAVIERHYANLKAWRETGDKILSEPHHPEYNNRWNAHVGNRPTKPKMPRKPSKPKVGTADLSPAKQKLRGQGVDATINHEGYHHTMEQMENHYGAHTANAVHSKLLSFHDPDTLAEVGTFIHKRMGYKTKSKKFQEEILAHSRDILVDPKKRASFKAHVNNDEKFAQHIKNLKLGNKNAHAWAKTAKPEDFFPGLGKHSPDLGKTMSIGHSELGNPQSAVGGHSLLQDKNDKLKKKLKKRKSVKLDKAIADLEEIESLTKGKMKEEVLAESDYGPKHLDLYNKADNVRRKMKRQGEQVEAAGPNRAVRQTQVSAKQSADQAAKEAKAKSKKNPVKVYTEEEKKKLAEDLKTKRPQWILKAEDVD